MSARVACGNCGGRIDLPDGFAKAKIRCPECGYYTEVPTDKRSAAPPPDSPRSARPATPEPPPARAKPVVRARKSIDPRDHRPQFEADVPHGPPLLDGTQDFDDDKPYAVPGTGTKQCRHCRGELPLDAKLCVHCGRNLATGGRVERDFQPINREWEEEYPLTRRLQVMAGAQVVNVLGSLSALASVESAGFIDVFWCFAFAVFHGALLAFIIGTFDTLAVRRTGKGSATLTRLRRVAFVPFPSEKVPWKDSHAVGFVATHDAGLVAWVVFIYLLLLCVLPGLVFYWFVIRPERFHVILCDVHGGTDAIIFRGNDREQVAEMAKVIAEATGLWHKTEF